MKYGRSLQELAIELDRQAKVKKDYVATAGAMQMTAVNENFDLVIGNTPFQLNENETRQENGKDYSCYFVYKESHKMDSKEFAHLVDGAIEEAKELGIQTDTPEQLARYKEEWSK